MLTTHFLWGFFKIFPFFVFVNIFLKIFGVFDDVLFTYESLIYGFMGNFVYSLWQVLQFLGDESDNIKPLSKKRLIFLAVRPFAAGLSSFVISALVVAIFSGLGDNVESFFKNTGTALVVGIISGMFFDHLTNQKFLDKFFEKKIQNKIFDKE